MARPESLEDIEMENVEFANIEVDKITLDPALLKGYTAFLEAATRAGAEVDSSAYRGVRFLRYPNMAEQEEQLRRAQARWDEGKKYYEHLAGVGDVEYNWHRGVAEEWAAREGMPFPPDHDPIAAIDVVIREAVEA
jgi:hypothetical protein